MDSSLPEGYEIRELETDAFGRLWRGPAKLFFDEVTPLFRGREFLNDTRPDPARWRNPAPAENPLTSLGSSTNGCGKSLSIFERAKTR
jgi:hypothetical protein